MGVTTTNYIYIYILVGVLGYNLYTIKKYKEIYMIVVLPGVHVCNYYIIINIKSSGGAGLQCCDYEI